MTIMNLNVIPRTRKLVPTTKIRINNAARLAELRSEMQTTERKTEANYDRIVREMQSMLMTSRSQKKQ